MAEAAQEERWNHTAALRADIHNLLRKKPLSPLKFHPFHRHKKRPPPKPTPGGVEMLTRALCGSHAWAKPGG